VGVVSEGVIVAVDVELYVKVGVAVGLAVLEGSIVWLGVHVALVIISSFWLV
jgi:hypothetical protein